MNRMHFEPIRIYFSDLRSSAGVRQAIVRVFTDWTTGCIQATLHTHSLNSIFLNYIQFYSFFLNFVFFQKNWKEWSWGYACIMMHCGIYASGLHHNKERIRMFRVIWLKWRGMDLKITKITAKYSFIGW